MLFWESFEINLVCRLGLRAFCNKNMSSTLKLRFQNKHNLSDFKLFIYWKISTLQGPKKELKERKEKKKKDNRKIRMDQITDMLA